MRISDWSSDVCSSDLLPCSQQLADSLIVYPGIIAGKGQTLDSAVADRVEQPVGNAAQAKAAAGDQHVVTQQPVERGCGIRIELFHCVPTCCVCNGSKA